jgi:hypothetical protein
MQTDLDIDRLHRVALDPLPGRQEGQTTLDCHTVAGLIELDETEITVLLPVMRWLNHVLPMLLCILQEHGIRCVHREGLYRLRIGTDVLIRFMSLPSAGSHTQMLLNIYHLLAGFRGPVVAFSRSGRDDSIITEAMHQYLDLDLIDYMLEQL